MAIDRGLYIYFCNSRLFNLTKETMWLDILRAHSLKGNSLGQIAAGKLVARHERKEDEDFGSG